MAEISWIKLKTDMFDSTKIRLIEKLPEGDTILVIWIKLLTAAGKSNCNGYIMLTENIPMNIEEMSVIFDRPLNTVRLALEAFKRYGMIDIDADEVVRIANWEKHQNIDGMEKIRVQNRLRKQKQREQQKALVAPKEDKKEDVSRDSHVTVTPSHAIEEEVEEDIDKEKDINISTTTDRSREVFKSVQENIRYSLSAIEIQEIEYWLQDYPHDLILEAIRRAVLANKVTLRYVEGILKEWQQKRITTLAEVERDDEAFKQQKKGGKRYGGNSKNVQSNNQSERNNYSL